MERGRAMFIRFSFFVSEEERTTGGLLEDSGRVMRSGQRGGQREERTATMVDTKKGSIYIKRAFLIKKRVVFN